MTNITAAEARTWFNEPCMVGIDEAGRGSVMGPMVYGAAACPVAYEEELKARKYDDSKALVAAKRDSLFDQMKADTQLVWTVDAISAQHISSHMLAPSRTSLNEIALQSTLGLLRKLQEDGMNIVAVFVDTVGDADKYTARLSRELPGVKFTVCPKADAIYPIVSAASIAAKVTRDRLQAAIDGDTDTGSGYPGDAVTKAWLTSRIDPVFGFPDDVRFSWQTAVTMLQEKATAITFEADVDDSAQATLSFAQPAGGTCSAAADRHPFFRARRIQLAPAGSW